MTEHQQSYQYQQQRPTDAFKGILPEKGPSSSQVLAVVTLLPLGGILLLLSGLTLTGTLIGLAVTTPLLVIFSPVLIPAALTIALAITGFLTSGAFSVISLSAFSWMINYLRGTRLPEQVERAQRGAQETAGHFTKHAIETGQIVQSKAQEAAGKAQGGANT